MKTTLPPALVQAYRQAWYEVWLPAPGQMSSQVQDTPSLLQVDVAHAPLRQTMQRLNAHQACLLTACNPRGQLLPAAENTRRIQALRQALQAKGWTWAPALGRDPQGQWPGEESLLIWHMDRAQARHWGRQWAQNAVLVFGDDAIPRLECLR